MAKRYVLSTIIGTGVGEEDAFRPAVADYPCNWVIAIAPDHQTNPNKKWVLCVVGATQTTLSSMGTNSNITVLPFGPDRLGDAWMSIGTTSERNRFANAVSQRTGVVVQRDDQRTLREIVTEIGLAVDPNFDADNLDVRDVIG